MKKQILLGASILLTIAGFSQSYRVVKTPAKAVDRAAELAAVRELGNQETSVSSTAAQPQIEAARTAGYSWSLLCGSANAYGMLSNNQKPLQYNVALGAISFIHRKSDFYAESPTLPSAARNGVIVAEVTSNWGTTWDSTCIYSNATDWGRYPQGAIYNPTGNTSMANAYVVGSGPTVGANSFSGNWYASKKLNTFNTAASTAAGAQQFYTFNSGPYTAAMPRHAWPRDGFSVTNDGVLHSLGILGDNLQNTTTMRGYAVISGTFNTSTSVVDWKIDSILPACIMKPDGISKHLQEGQMVWNPAGTIGYVVGIGVRAGATLANRSYQPIIYKIDKTQGSGATWTLTSQLDFNTTFTTIPYHLPGRPVTYPVVNGDTTAMPFTNDFDLTIDANNNLHVGILFMSGFSDHPDSLNYYTTYGSIINPGNNYKWQHLPGDRPYIYDFIGDGVAPWKLQVVDSMSSEGPGTTTGSGGYSENPWDNTGTSGSKLTVDGRLQLGRTPDGQYITYAWAESDTLFTSGQLKYNALPELKLRSMALTSGTNSYVMDIGPEINTTNPDNNVRTRATLHYMSPMTGAATIYTSTSAAYTVEIAVPLTVTNSNPYAQLTNNATWFGKATAPFRYKQASTVGIAENSALLEASQIYPNPASNLATLKLALDKGSNLNVRILNAVGQVVKTINTNVPAGECNVRLDLSGLASGIYFVNVKAGNAETTKKLVID